MEICNEMIKLRKWLNDNKITWMDASEDYGTGGGGKLFHFGCVALILILWVIKYL